ncbi:hypothetical protein ACTFIT_008862 [Dictyostelium discoideum]
MESDKKFLYSTSCFEPVISQRTQCDGSGSCGTGVCGGIQPSDIDCKGLLRDYAATHYPGNSYCTSTHTNFDCGCYIKPLNTICDYHRVALSPRPPYYDVHEITNVQVKYNVELFLDDKKLSVGTSDSSQIKYSFDGSFVPDLTLKSRKLVQMGNDFYDLSGAADRGGGVPGQFGDFQGTSINDLKNSIHSNIKFAHGIISNVNSVRNGHKVSIKADISKPGCNVLPNGGVKFPTRIGDLLYSADKDGVLYGYPSQHSPINIYLTIPNKNIISFTKIIKEVCPIAQNLILKESCKNCLSEASFFFFTY